MVDVADDSSSEENKGSKLPLLIGLVAILLGAGGGFMAVQNGFIGVAEADAMPAAESNPTAPSSEIADLAFVALDPMVISFSEGSSRRLLRFVGVLEVVPSAIEEVETLKPRIMDILNGFLTALDIEDLEEPAALLKIQSHLFHRVRIVAGEDRINDLLVVEFVIN